MIEFEDVILDDQDGNSSLADLMGCCAAVALVVIGFCAIVAVVVTYG